MSKEFLHMQMLAGIITEGEYKAKLNENETTAVGKKVEAAVEDKLEAKVDALTPQQKDQLRKELAQLGVTANSEIKDVVNKLDESLLEGEGDIKKKIADILGGVGQTLIGSLLVPFIPMYIGSLDPTNIGMVGGLAITSAVGGGLIGLAKLLGAEDPKKPLKENFVGIGAINSPFAAREKTDYEIAFEHYAKGTSLNERKDEDEEDEEDEDYSDYFFDIDTPLDETMSFTATEEAPRILSKYRELKAENPEVTPGDIADALGLDSNMVAATLNANLNKNFPLDLDWGGDYSDEDLDYDIKITEYDTDTETEKETETETDKGRKRRRNLDDDETSPDTPPKALKESKRPLRVKAKRSK